MTPVISTSRAAGTRSTRQVNRAGRRWPNVLWKGVAAERRRLVLTAVLLALAGLASLIATGAHGSWACLAPSAAAWGVPATQERPALSDARSAYETLGKFAAADKQQPLRAVSGRLSVPFPDPSELDKGEIVAYEENPHFTYVVVDATKAYGSAAAETAGKAPRLLRRLVHLKPSTFVIDDQVQVPAATNQASWVVVARSQPKVTGRRLAISQGKDELLCVNLQPKEATVSAAKPPADETKPAGSRVQVTAQVAKDQVRFFNVLHVRPIDQASEPSIEMTGGDDEVSLTVRADGKVYGLSLPTGRVGPGNIAVSQADGGAVLSGRLLPSGVLPSGPEGAKLLERWDSAYRSDRRPGWDIGRPSTELKKLVEDGTVRPCRAIELGSGLGTDSIFLASKGFEVTAIDIAPTALNLAKERASKAGVKVRWLLADATATPALEPFDFIYDRGCYHGVRRQNAAGYVETVRRYSRPGTRILLLAGNANEPPPHYGPPRVKEEELRGDFSKLFEFERLQETRFDTLDPAGRGALSWTVLLRRKAGP